MIFIFLFYSYSDLAGEPCRTSRYILFFSQKTFEEIKTETWVRLGNYLGEYAVSGENKITEMIGFLVRVGVLS